MKRFCYDGDNVVFKLVLEENCFLFDVVYLVDNIVIWFKFLVVRFWFI